MTVPYSLQIKCDIMHMNMDCMIAKYVQKSIRLKFVKLILSVPKKEWPVCGKGTQRNGRDGGGRNNELHGKGFKASVNKHSILKRGIKYILAFFFPSSPQYHVMVTFLLCFLSIFRLFLWRVRCICRDDNKTSQFIVSFSVCHGLSQKYVCELFLCLLKTTDPNRMPLRTSKWDTVSFQNK